MEPDNPLLDDFILSLSRRRPARVCFIPTASADSATYITRFYRAFSGRGIPTDLTLFDSAALPRRPAQTRDLAAFVRREQMGRLRAFFIRFARPRARSGMTQGSN